MAAPEAIQTTPVIRVLLRAWESQAELRLKSSPGRWEVVDINILRQQIWFRRLFGMHWHLAGLPAAWRTDGSRNRHLCIRTHAVSHLEGAVPRMQVQVLRRKLAWWGGERWGDRCGQEWGSSLSLHLSLSLSFFIYNMAGEWKYQRAGR